MFPIRSRQRRFRVPVVTSALIVCNLLVFCWELLQGPALPELIAEWGLRPAFFVSYWWVPSLSVWLPLISSMFLHGGWLHLGGNVLFLWVFGGNVEDRLGHTRFLALYFLAGFAAAFIQVLMSFDSVAPRIGASGAIAGVLGAYLFLFPRAKVLTVVVVIVVPPIPGVTRDLSAPGVVCRSVYFGHCFARNRRGALRRNSLLGAYRRVHCRSAPDTRARP